MKTNKLKIKTIEKLQESPEAEKCGEKTKEQVSKENLKDLKESLSVYQEIRKELGNAYKEQKTSMATIEKLSQEAESLKKELDSNTKTIETLSKDLDAYKVRDAKVEKLAMEKRLEKLSKDFGELGQLKTVEQLSKLPKEVIVEFEEITTVALRKKSNEQLSIATVPTQATPSKPAEAKAPPKAEQLSGDSFAKGICNVLAKQQGVDGADSKRTLTL